MSKFFTIDEMLYSSTAVKKKIDNTPNEIEMRNLTYLMDYCLDKIREVWGNAIYVNSGYRSDSLNTAVNGAKNSQHKSGEAADITAGSKSNNKILFNMIINSNIDFDQLIDEKDYKWIHVSCRYNMIGNRRQVLHL